MRNQYPMKTSYSEKYQLDLHPFMYPMLTSKYSKNPHPVVSQMSGLVV